MGFSLFVSKPSVLVPIVLVLLASFYQPSHGLSRYGRIMPEDNSTRRLFGSRATPLNCGDLVVPSQCSQDSKCSWCNSDVLDDMCFTRTEASRLPPEVFSCD